MLKTFAVAIVLLASAGCSQWVPSFYAIDVRQGNYIDQEMVAQLRHGMTKRQVQFLLGTPPIVDPFHQDRWDYVYSFRPESGEETIHRQVTLYFSGDRLTRFEASVDPSEEGEDG